LPQLGDHAGFAGTFEHQLQDDGVSPLFGWPPRIWMSCGPGVQHGGAGGVRSRHGDRACVKLASPCEGRQAVEKTTMPYRNISHLPDSVTDNVPRHGQEIYKEAFNSALDEYQDPDDRRGDASFEETAHKVAWSAVKHSYDKGDDDKWHRK